MSLATYITRNGIVTLAVRLSFPTYNQLPLLLDDDKQQLLKTVLEKQARVHSCEISQLEFTASNLTFTLCYPPQFTIPSLVNILKGTTSKSLRQAFPELFKSFPELPQNPKSVWAIGYTALSVPPPEIEQILLDKYGDKNDVHRSYFK